MIRAQLTRILQAQRDDVPTEFGDLLRACGQGHTPLLQLLGRTREGEAQNWFVAGFEPYFYVAAPATLSAPDLNELHVFLETVCAAAAPARNYGSSSSAGSSMQFKRVELVHALTSMDTYHAAPRALLRLTAFVPGVVARLRDVWLKRYPRGLRYNGHLLEPLVFEADVKFHTRFGIDIEAVPYGWIDAKAGSYAEAHDALVLKHCDRTLCMHYKDLVVHKPEGEFIGNAPLKMSTYDIECLGRKGVFPIAEIDPIGEIAVETHDNINGAAQPIDSLCFTTAVRNDADPLAQRERELCAGSDRFDLDLALADLEPNPKPNPPARTPRMVVRCANESQMLLAFTRYIVAHRPEHLGSYNGDKFDMPYLMGRAEQLGIVEQFAQMGRTPGRRLKLEANNFQSRAYGRSEGFNVTDSDWESNDELRNLQKDIIKRRSYTLEAVAAAELNDHKKPMPHQEITTHHHGTLAQQYRLFDYNFHDVRLTTGIFYKKKTLCNQIEMSRVVGVDVDTLITGGQQVKIHRLILATARDRGFVVPTYARDDYIKPEEVEAGSDSDSADSSDDEANDRPRRKRAKRQVLHMPTTAMAATPSDGIGLRTHHTFMSQSGKAKAPAEGDGPGYQGATVVEPKRGFYELPITVLDFSSLYPSIMIQHNLCYSSLLPPIVGAQSCSCREPTPAMPAGKYVCARCGQCMRCSTDAAEQCRCMTVTPFGARFVSTRTRQGVLPQILSDVLSARVKTKRELAAAKAAGNEELAAVLDGRQNAFKVTANSIYGFTGVSKGKMPCVAISASVTSYGREMIDFVIRLIERKFQGRGIVQTVPELRDVEFSASVIYGDTDSVMIRSGALTVKEAIAFGKYAARYICASFAATWLLAGEQRALIDQFIGVDFVGTIHDALFEHTDTFCDQVLNASKSAIAIVFEKVLYPYLLVNKKRYCGGYWLSADRMDHVHQSGLESVRRDNCEYASHLIGAVIEHLHTPGGSAEGALQLAYQGVKRLLRGDVPIDELVITRGYTRLPQDYACADKQPHMLVNKKRGAREPGSEYQLGDRIRYVFACTPEVAACKTKRLVKGWMCVECPDYVERTGMALYYERYLDKQLVNPLTRIFDAIYGPGFSAAKLFSKPDTVVQARPVNAPILRAFGPGVRAPAAAGGVAPAPATPKALRQMDTRTAIDRFKKRPVQTTLSFALPAAGTKRAAPDDRH
jgi:DNA polymerase elongation subunit (family B)